MGKAGKNLDEFLEIIGMRRGRCISNVVKFRRAPTSEPDGSATARPRARKSICAIICWRERLPSSRPVSS